MSTTQSFEELFDRVEITEWKPVATIQGKQIPLKTGQYDVTPYWKDVDRPNTGNWRVDNVTHAAWLALAVQSGSIFKKIEIRKDFGGKIYVEASTILRTPYMREAFDHHITARTTMTLNEYALICSSIHARIDAWIKDYCERTKREFRYDEFLGLNIDPTEVSLPEYIVWRRLWVQRLQAYSYSQIQMFQEKLLDETLSDEMRRRYQFALVRSQLDQTEAYRQMEIMELAVNALLTP